MRYRANVLRVQAHAVKDSTRRAHLIFRIEAML
jgi:hypothetical protein